MRFVLGLSVFLIVVMGLELAVPLTTADLDRVQSQRRRETLVFEEIRPPSIAPFHLIGAQFDRYLNEILYVGGVAYGAIDGGRAGYAVGGFEIGLVWPVVSGFSLDMKCLLGGSGGGGVPVKGGLFLQPQMGLIWAVSDEMHFRMSAGQYLSMDNDFSGLVWNFGLIFPSRHLTLPYES